jgi:phage terminase large subunit-like protein
VQLVSASRGKDVRAEPTVRRYEEGHVHHVGTFPALERELTSWRPGRPSPNRLDALVWADAALDMPVVSERPPSRSYTSLR